MIVSIARAGVPRLGKLTLVMLLAALWFGLPSRADGGLTVIITGTIPDDDRYQVTSLLTVLDDSNQPIKNLTADDLEITVDGKPVTSSISIEPVNNQPLEVVLAVDLSLRESNKAAMGPVRSVAQHFVNSLNDKDYLSVRTFGVTPLLNIAERMQLDDRGRKTMTAFIADNVTEQGDYTAFYEAIDEAAQSLPTAGDLAGRPLVVVLTNIGKTNVRGSDFETAKRNVENGSIPVYIYSFSELGKPNQEDNAKFADATNGDSEYRPQAEELAKPIGTLTESLRAGFKITFQPPTGTLGEAKFSVQVNQENGSGQAEASFQINPPLVQIPALDIPAEIKRGAPLKFTVQPIPSNLVAFVEARINNDQSLGIDDETPYEFEWDSMNAADGNYTLFVTGLDRAGRMFTTAQTFKVISTIIPRPIIQAVWGSDILLEAELDPPFENGTVNYYLIEGEKTTKIPPTFVESHPAYPPKPTLPTSYLFKAEAVNQAGEPTAEFQYEVIFLPPDPLNFNWLYSIILMALAHALLLALLFIWGRQRKLAIARLQQTCRLTLINTGNLASAYQLIAVAEEHALQFRFQEQHLAYDKAPLSSAGRPLEPAPSVETTAQPAPDAPSQSRGSAAANGSDRQNFGKVSETGRAGLGLLSTIRTIPIIGRPVQRLFGGFRSIRTRFGSLLRLPRQIFAPVKRLTPQLGRYSRVPVPASASASNEKMTTAPRGAETTEARMRTTRQTPTVKAQRPLNAKDQPGPGTNLRASNWDTYVDFLTHTFKPGETRLIQLLVQPQNPPPETHCYPFTVTIKTVISTDQADLPVKCCKVKRCIKIAGIPGWYYAFFPLGLFLLGFLLADLFWLFMLWLTPHIDIYLNTLVGSPWG